MELLAAFCTGIVAGILLSVVVRRFHAAFVMESLPSGFLPASGVERRGESTLIIFFSAIFSLLAAWALKDPFQIAAALAFIYLLIAMAFIDIEHQVLPDTLTIPLIILGLAVNFTAIFVEFKMALLGAALGYGILWTVNALFRLVRKKEGMGYGDFKLLAGLGAWTGAIQLLPIILVSSVLAILAAVIMRLTKCQDFSVPIPFGPFLALAGFLSLLWGGAVMEWYMGLLRG